MPQQAQAAPGEDCSASDRSNKRRKTIKHFEPDAAFQIRQRQDDDFWDEYEYDLGNDFSSDESSSEEELDEYEEEEDGEN